MEEFLKGYLRAPYSPKTVAMFIIAFKSHLDYLSSLTGFDEDSIRDLADDDYVRDGQRLWKRDHITEFQRIGRSFWKRIQNSGYKAFLRLEDDSTMKKILDSLGSVDYNGGRIQYDDFENRNSRFMAIINLISDLRDRRNTILSLDLSNQGFENDVDMLHDMDMLIDELQEHTILTELNLEENRLNDHYCKKLCKLKNLPLKRLILKNNPSISLEIISKLKEFIPEVIY